MHHYRRLFMSTLFTLMACTNLSAKPAQEQTLADVVDHVADAVVNITLIHTDKPQTPPQPATQFGAGSGVIIDAKHGYIITNAHVIKDASALNVALKDGRQYRAKTIGADPATDIAIIQIPQQKLKQAKIGNSDQLRVGDRVTTIGNPFGLHQTVTSGVISALHRDDLHIEDFEDFIQTDAPINPGNSGGALLNSQGELIGINTAIWSNQPNAGNVGIGFSIPTSLAMPVAKQLIQNGEVKRGLLGVTIQKLNPNLASLLHSKDANGALVTQVFPGSPADKAHIKAGDILTSINNHKIASSSELRNISGLIPIGEKAKLIWQHSSKTKKASVELMDPKQMPAPHSKLQGFQCRSVEGMTMTGETIHGLSVDFVDPNSLAWLSGLQSGDVIVEVNQAPLKNLKQLNDIASKSSEILFKVYRHNGFYFLALQTKGT